MSAEYVATWLSGLGASALSGVLLIAQAGTPLIELSAFDKGLAVGVIILLSGMCGALLWHIMGSAKADVASREAMAKAVQGLADSVKGLNDTQAQTRLDHAAQQAETRETLNELHRTVMSCGARGQRASGGG